MNSDLLNDLVGASEDALLEQIAGDGRVVVPLVEIPGPASLLKGLADRGLIQAWKFGVALTPMAARRLGLRIDAEGERWLRPGQPDRTARRGYRRGERDWMATMDPAVIDRNECNEKWVL